MDHTIVQFPSNDKTFFSQVIVLKCVHLLDYFSLFICRTNLLCVIEHCTAEKHRMVDYSNYYLLDYLVSLSGFCLICHK